MDSQTESSKSVEQALADMRGIPTRDQLLEMLRNNIVAVTFDKLNGDERTMPCTLQEQYLPKADKTDPLSQKKVREISDKVIAAWAIESDGFRSFRYDRVKRVEIVEKVDKSS